MRIQADQARLQTTRTSGVAHERPRLVDAEEKEALPAEQPSTPDDRVVREEPSEIAQALSSNSWTSTIVSQPLRFAGWVPADVRAKIRSGDLSEGVTVFAQEDGSKVVVWADTEHDPVEVELYRTFSESPSFYLEKTQDADTARRLAEGFATWNREMHHLVVDLGMRPGEARRMIARVDRAVFKAVLEATGAAFAVGVGAGRPAASRMIARRPGRWRSTKSERIGFTGAAQGPAFKYRKNPGGPRSPEEAMAIAKKHGVEFPEEAWVVFVDGPKAITIPAGADAVYFSTLRSRRITWDSLVHSGTGKIPVRVRRSVLESDEAIVSTLTHEAYELRALEREFMQRESMSPRELAGRINERNNGGFANNYHERAWDAANLAIKKMREERK